MHKDSISIQILGSNQFKIDQYRRQIASLINKEITALLYDHPALEALYTNKTLPDLLIVLLDDITVDALKQLTALPSADRPALLVITENNHNQQKMRLAMQAGAQDFFTDPIDEQELCNTLNRIIFNVRRVQAKQGIVTTVINAKGGSGASFIACNLAHIASVLSDADADIVLVDFDLQFGTQSLNLDVKPLHTIVEALNDIDKLDFDAINGYMTPYKSGLSLLSTQPEQLILPGEINAENGDKLLTLLTSHYDHIFIDLPRYIDALFAIVLERSDQIIIIIQLTVAHVHDAKRLINILKSEFNISAKNILIVVNRYDANSHIDLDDVKSTLQSSNVYMVPTDFNNALQSSNLGIPIYDYARNSPITRSLTLLLKALNVTIKENSNYKTLFKNLFTK